MAKARSAASGLANTYVELRNTAGRADPTDRLGSKPRVSTAVRGCRAPPCGSSCSDIRTPAPSVAPGSSTGTPAFLISDYGIPNYLDAGFRGATTKSLSTGALEAGSEQIRSAPHSIGRDPNRLTPLGKSLFSRLPGRASTVAPSGGTAKLVRRGRLAASVHHRPLHPTIVLTELVFSGAGRHL